MFILADLCNLESPVSVRYFSISLGITPYFSHDPDPDYFNSLHETAQAGKTNTMNALYNEDVGITACSNGLVVSLDAIGVIYLVINIHFSGNGSIYSILCRTKRNNITLIVGLLYRHVYILGLH